MASYVLALLSNCCPHNSSFFIERIIFHVQTRNTLTVVGWGLTAGAINTYSLSTLTRFASDQGWRLNRKQNTVAQNLILFYSPVLSWFGIPWYSSFSQRCHVTCEGAKCTMTTKFWIVGKFLYCSTMLNFL